MALGLSSPLPCPPTARRSRCKGARNAREPATHPCMGLPLSRAFADRARSGCVGSLLLPVSAHFGAPAWNTSAAPPRAARRKGAREHRAARERSDELFRRPVRGGSDARYSCSCPDLFSIHSAATSIPRAGSEASWRSSCVTSRESRCTLYPDRGKSRRVEFVRLDEREDLGV